MERVISTEMQPLILENGTVIAAAGTKESVPVEVTLSAKDRKLYVDRGRLTILKPATTQSSGGSLEQPLAPAATKSEKAGK